MLVSVITLLGNTKLNEHNRTKQHLLMGKSLPVGKWLFITPNQNFTFSPGQKLIECHMCFWSLDFCNHAKDYP